MDDDEFKMDTSHIGTAYIAPSNGFYELSGKGFRLIVELEKDIAFVMRKLESKELEHLMYDQCLKEEEAIDE
jgi:hypothetical protein